jgi:hypothetical protein
LRAIQAKFIDSVDAFDPDFRDFQEAAKMERLILGDPTERREDVKTSRLIVELGESELLDAARTIERAVTDDFYLRKPRNDPS